MNTKEFLVYFSGVDVLRAQYQREQAVYAEQGLEGPHLPLDAGIRGAAEIYGTRMLTIGLHFGTMVCRVTGIDAAYRGIRYLSRSDPEDPSVR